MHIPLFQQTLYRWYEANKRVLPWRETQDPYKIWLSEIILQQTRVAQGIDYYLRFIDRFPTVQDLANADEDEVLLLWQGLGYYSRARNLHQAAKQIVLQRSNLTGVAGLTAQRSFSDSGLSAQAVFAFWRSLPGVGDYTAGAIASFAYNLPYVAMDGNVYRVLARLFDDDTVFDTEQGKKHFHALDETLLDRTNPRLFNSAIMEFGALYCTPQNPDCEHCDLRRFCLGYAHHTAEVLPLRKVKKPLKDRYLHYTIYIDKECCTLIHQRMEKDIWQHLWEFALIEDKTKQPVGRAKPAKPAKPAKLELTHTLSHQRIHALFEVCRCNELPAIDGMVKVRWQELENYAFSRLTLRALADFRL